MLARLPYKAGVTRLLTRSISQALKHQRSSLPLRAASSSSATAEKPAVKSLQQEEKLGDMAQAITTKYRKDYKAPPYWVEQVHLNFLLADEATTVKSELHMTPNYGSEAAEPPPLVLDGRGDMELLGVKVGGKALGASDYELTPKTLTLKGLPKGPFTVEIDTKIKPQENTSLEGLYRSSGNFCTQCEAEGFRGITFFLDRPDVMSKYTVRVEADKNSCPVLLSNGNLTESGDLEGGRHFTVWEDPHAKPCYLFALVAGGAEGSLSRLADKFTTKSGRVVDLHFYASKDNIEKCKWAMESLKRAMKWDEDKFGLEYDLDLFNVVAVSDFNMGAMENKSLNIFNSRLVMASPETATDLDYHRIEGVVAHEYFHNWTGNRVTCRDWFQLTLKEGLTVYRDQEFSADMHSRSLKRIEDVIRLRTSQFPEDAGAMSHPVRPDSFVKIDNFYSVTVYEKGAEVVRLYETLLSQEGFRKGMDLYFKRHDGTAVTCDDFRSAMADANGVDLSLLTAWYEQAGTPRVVVKSAHSAADKTLTLTISQSIPPTPGQASKRPVPVPLKVGLLGPDGKDLPLKLKESTPKNGTSLGPADVLVLSEAEHSYVFEGVAEKPVLSLLRGFSAPIILEVEGQGEEELLFLLAHDSDPFCRWEAGQKLYKALLLKLYNEAGSEVSEEALSKAGGVPSKLVQAIGAVLNDKELDSSLIAATVALPSSAEFVQAIPELDPLRLYNVRRYVLKTLAKELRGDFEAALKASEIDAPYEPSHEQASKRSLKNTALAYLSQLEEPALQADLLHRVKTAKNQTDKAAALACLADSPCPEREEALAAFYKEFEDQPLVLLKWFALQARSNVPGNLEAVKKLAELPTFSITTPNFCYSLFIGFGGSVVNFHAADGSGYAWYADTILKMDAINKQVASRMLSSSAFTQLKEYDTKRQGLMRAQLEKILAANGLSENVQEIATKSLA